MSDIKERLRKFGGSDQRIWKVMDEAADEIARLEEQVLALQHIADRDEERLERMRTYIVQLENVIIHLERVIFRLENQ